MRIVIILIDLCGIYLAFKTTLLNNGTSSEFRISVLAIDLRADTTKKIAVGQDINSIETNRFRMKSGVSLIELNIEPSWIRNASIRPFSKFLQKTSLLLRFGMMSDVITWSLSFRIDASIEILFSIAQTRIHPFVWSIARNKATFNHWKLSFPSRTEFRSVSNRGNTGRMMWNCKKTNCNYIANKLSAENAIPGLDTISAFKKYCNLKRFVSAEFSSISKKSFPWFAYNLCVSIWAFFIIQKLCNAKSIKNSAEMRVGNCSTFSHFYSYETFFFRIFAAFEWYLGLLKSFYQSVKICPCRTRAKFLQTCNNCSSRRPWRLGVCNQNMFNNIDWIANLITHQHKFLRIPSFSNPWYLWQLQCTELGGQFEIRFDPRFEDTWI